MELSMRPFLLCFFAVVFTGAAMAAEIAGSAFRWGNWRGAAYTVDATGRFSHCSISAPYVAGDHLYFSVNREASVTVAIWNPDPIFIQDQRIPVKLTVDRRAPFYGEAVAASENFAYLTLYEFERAMTAFRKGFRLQITTGNRTSHYSLAGTYRALEATRQCAIRHLDYVGSPTPRTEGVANVDKSLLYQIATGMIAELGVTDFRYLTDEEMRAFSDDDAVFWTSPSVGMMGGVYIRPAGNIRNLRDTDSQELQEIGSGCDGDIISGARGLDTDDFPTREMRAICSQEEQVVETIVSKMLVDELILYTILIFNDPTEPERPLLEEDRRQMNEDVITRAASLVLTTRQ